MDELKIKLTTNKIAKGLLTTILNKVIHKKLGYNIDIQISDVDVTVVDGKVHLHINADAETTKDEFMKIVNTIV